MDKWFLYIRASTFNGLAQRTPGAWITQFVKISEHASCILAISSSERPSPTNSAHSASHPRKTFSDRESHSKIADLHSRDSGPLSSSLILTAMQVKSSENLSDSVNRTASLRICSTRSAGPSELQFCTHSVSRSGPNNSPAGERHSVTPSE